MSFRTFVREQGKYYSTELVDVEEHSKCLSGYLADCAGDSLELYYKLKKAGAIRVRGRRQIERDTNDPLAYHYWVENRGIVFEKHGGVQTIIDKEMYYKNADISDVEVAEYSGFFRSELPQGNNKLVLQIIKQMKEGIISDLQLLNLITTYRNKNKKPVKKPSHLIY